MTKSTLSQSHLLYCLLPIVYYNRRMSLLLDDTSSRIAGRLRLERENRGWSLADLAERSGVSKATISKIEREEVSPTAVILVRLAGAFDLTLAGLLLRAEGAGDRLSRTAGQRVVFPASSYAHIRQAVWVQTGDLVILEGGDRQLLRAGDCLGFGPPSE